MMHSLLATDESRTRLIQRAVLGAVMFPHGAQKLLGWFGGYGWDGTMGYLTGTVGLPVVVAALVILAESIGAIALVLGVGTRVAALGIAAVMIGAVLTSHLEAGFFMNWFGNQTGEGFEYHLLALALAAPLVVAGGGAYALDRVVLRWLERAPSQSAAHQPASVRGV
jgi:putative oxidoreductase